MDLGYNISFTIAALVIDVVLFFIVSLNYSSANLVNKRFRYFLVAGMTMFALNIATVITNSIAAKLPDWANVLFNSIYFASTAVVALLFFYYCCSFALKGTTKKTQRIFFIANMVALGLYIAALVVNGFTGWYFRFDYAQKFPYVHGWFFMPISIFSMIFVVESLTVFIVKRKQFNNRQIICTAIFFAAFFVAYGMQLLFFEKTLLSDFGCAMGSLLVFFSLETPDYARLVLTLDELNKLKGSLELQVEARTEELREEKASYGELTLETLSSLASLIDAKDHYTNGHSFRVASYAKGIAKTLGYSDAEAEQIYLAGLVHDVGKIAISESILRKPGKLEPNEYATIQSHAAIGGDILRGIKRFPAFREVARYHHERYDGQGYPDKLKGEQIPEFARIVAVADCFDAMTSDRSYRKALSDEVALSELKEGSGTQFDPAFVEAFTKLYSSFPNSIREHVDDLAEGIE